MRVLFFDYDGLTFGLSSRWGVSCLLELSQPKLGLLAIEEVRITLLGPLRSWLIKAVIGSTKASPALSEEHQRFNSLVYPTEAILNLLDVLWTLETIKFGSIDVPTIMFGNPNDHVTNFRVKATNAFLRFGEVPKALHCVTNSEHPHVIASDILSPSSVDEISDAAVLFLKTHIVRENVRSGLVEDKLSETTHIERNRAGSVQKGMGSFASYSSLKDLTKPFEAA